MNRAGSNSVAQKHRLERATLADRERIKRCRTCNASSRDVTLYHCPIKLETHTEIGFLCNECRELQS